MWENGTVLKVRSGLLPNDHIRWGDRASVVGAADFRPDSDLQLGPQMEINRCTIPNRTGMALTNIARAQPM